MTNNIDPQPPVHPPPRWLGSLLLLSLLALLNTHLFMTVFIGVDQYSFFTADLGDSISPYPAWVAVWPRPVWLTATANALLALCAYGIYHFIWWRLRASNQTKLHPFFRHVIAVSIPVFLAMLPSMVLGYVPLATFFLAVGGVTSVTLSLTGALKDPDVVVDDLTRDRWFQPAIYCVGGLALVGVQLTLFFLYVEGAGPPLANLFWDWRDHWDDHWTDFRGIGSEDATVTYGQLGIIMTGFTTVIFMLAAQGGPMLAALSPLGTRASPSPTVAGSEMPESADEVEIWQNRILGQLRAANMADNAGLTRAAIVSGECLDITDRGYDILMNEAQGLFLTADLVIDDTAKTVWNRPDAGSNLERVTTLPAGHGANAATYALLNIFGGEPQVTLVDREINERIRNKFGADVDNPADAAYSLIGRDIPLTSTSLGAWRVAKGKKVILVEQGPAQHPADW